MAWGFGYLSALCRSLWLNMRHDKQMMPAGEEERRERGRDKEGREGVRKSWREGEKGVREEGRDGGREGEKGGRERREGEKGVREEGRDGGRERKEGEMEGREGEEGVREGVRDGETGSGASELKTLLSFFFLSFPCDMLLSVMKRTRVRSTRTCWRP